MRKIVLRYNPKDENDYKIKAGHQPDVGAALALLKAGSDMLGEALTGAKNENVYQAILKLLLGGIDL